MHSILVHVTIKEGRLDEAVKGLEELVVPQSKSSPGFVSGIWSHRPDGTKGMGVVVLETEQDASAFVAAIQAEPAPDDAPVTIDSVEIYEVAAQA